MGPSGPAPTATGPEAQLTKQAEDVQSALGQLPKLDRLPAAVKTEVVAQITQTGVAAQTEVQNIISTETQLVNQVQETVTAVLPAGTQTALVAELTQTPVAAATTLAGAAETETAVVPKVAETAAAQAAETAIAVAPDPTQTELAIEWTKTVVPLFGPLMTDQPTETVIAQAVKTAAAEVSKTVVAPLNAATQTAIATELAGGLSDGLSTAVTTLGKTPGNPTPIETAFAVVATKTGMAAQTEVAELKETETPAAMAAVETAGEGVIETATELVANPVNTLTADLTDVGGLAGDVETIVPTETAVAFGALETSVAQAQTAVSTQQPYRTLTAIAPLFTQTPVGTNVAAVETSVAQAAQTAQPGLSKLGETLFGWTPTPTPTSTSVVVSGVQTLWKDGNQASHWWGQSPSLISGPASNCGSTDLLVPASVSDNVDGGNTVLQFTATENGAGCAFLIPSPVNATSYYASGHIQFDIELGPGFNGSNSIINVQYGMDGNVCTSETLGGLSTGSFTHVSVPFNNDFISNCNSTGSMQLVGLNVAYNNSGCGNLSGIQFYFNNLQITPN